MNQNVLIIGAGPVGMTLAVELVRYGVPVRIVEKAARRTTNAGLGALEPDPRTYWTGSRAGRRRS